VGRGFALPTETTSRPFPVGNASALVHPTGTVISYNDERQNGKHNPAIGMSFSQWREALYP